MTFATLINAVLEYGSIILGIMFALTTAVQLIVEVVKRLVPRVPTDLVVFLVSIALAVLMLFIGAEVLQITVMWYYAVGAVILGIFVAYAAMFGFDKFTEAWEKLQYYKMK
jgi:hypothetical protein